MCGPDLEKSQKLEKGGRGCEVDLLVCFMKCIIIDTFLQRPQDVHT